MSMSMATSFLMSVLMSIPNNLIPNSLITLKCIEVWIILLFQLSSDDMSMAKDITK